MKWRSVYKVMLHIGKDIVLEFCSPSKHGQSHWRREKVGWKVSQKAGSTLTRTQTYIFQQLGVAASVTVMCVPGFAVSLHLELRCPGSSEWRKDCKTKRKSAPLPCHCGPDLGVYPAAASPPFWVYSTLVLTCSDLCFHGTVSPSPLSKCPQGSAGWSRTGTFNCV